MNWLQLDLQRSPGDPRVGRVGLLGRGGPDALHLQLPLQGQPALQVRGGALRRDRRRLLAVPALPRDARSEAPRPALLLG